VIQILVLALVSIAVFAGLLVSKVETSRMRLVLSAIAVVSWLAFGLIGAMVATAILSVGILIADQVPTVSTL
jgi:predicted branched-subunit amino acid permease